jgi:hypothetical protein
MMTVSLTPGGDESVESFSQTYAIGSAFTLDTATEALITDLPLDGSEFTVACSGDGGDCGQAMATAIRIVTSDGPIPPGFPPFVLPPANEKMVRVSCLVLGGSVTVPAEASAFIASSGATRVRAAFVRANQVAFRNADTDLQLLGGHMRVGFTNAPE